MTSLAFVDGPSAGRRLSLESKLVIGREGVDVVLDDNLLSRRHASFEEIPQGVVVEDLGSTNGTWVNGTRIAAPVTLRPGDEVVLGANTLMLEGAPATAVDNRAPETMVAGAVAESSPLTAAAAVSPSAAPAAATMPTIPPTPVAATPAPAAPAPAVPTPTSQPDPGAFAPISAEGSRRIASRRMTPTILSLGTIVATAVALIIYFASSAPS